MLRITKEEFKKIYDDTILLDYIDLFYTEPADHQDLLNNFITSKLWRLNNLYTIVNKHGKRIKFNMNKAQHKVYAANLKHPRLIILKSRQQGISTLWLVSFFDDLVTMKDYSIGLMAQGQDEASTLLDRTKILWDTLSPEFKKFMGLYVTTDNTKEFKLSNGSSIFIRTSFRSTTLQRLHISEMGKIANKTPDKAKETKTGTLQAIAPGNTAVIESTAEGDNMFKDMWDNAVTYLGDMTDKDFFPVFLSWVDDPDCSLSKLQTPNDKQIKYFEEVEKELGIKLTQEQKNFWIAQYRELGDDIKQEYPATPVEAFMATKDGAYYARHYMLNVKKKKREVHIYDPNLDVQVAVDLGMNDTNVLTVFQKFKEEYRVIDEIYDSGEQISYYTDLLRKRPYADNIGHIILPHDAEVTELTSGKTRTEVFEEEFPQADITLLPRTSRIEGINMVRQAIKFLWINPKCSYLISCFLNYTKEWCDKTNRWKDKHVHDEYSNGGDSIRYMVLGSQDYVPTQKRYRRSKSHDV